MAKRKTTVLVTRLGYMVYCCDIDPSSILTITYTVAATKEMKQRFADMFGSQYADRMDFHTSIAYIKITMLSNEEIVYLFSFLPYYSPPFS